MKFIILGLSQYLQKDAPVQQSEHYVGYNILDPRVNFQSMPGRDIPFAPTQGLFAPRPYAVGQFKLRS